MTNLTAIGLYANGMPFCVTVGTDDYELVKKVMNIIFEGRAYTTYQGHISIEDTKYKQAVKFSLLDLVIHRLYSDLEAEYVRLQEKKAKEIETRNSHIYYGIKSAELKAELNKARESLDFAIGTDACESLVIPLQSKVDALRKACEETDLNYNTFLKISVIDSASRNVQEKMSVLQEYISSCKETR